MAPLTKSAQVMVLTMLVATLMKCGEAISLIPPKATVQIINNLAPAQNLTLHCKSKQDDIGFHTIGHGESYEFSFRPNAVAVITLFFCSFTWPADTSLHYFDIYVQERDETTCVFCSWKIWKEGACKYDPHVHAYVQCYHWNNSITHL